MSTKDSARISSRSRSANSEKNGKASALYLYSEDQTLIRQHAAWLAQQGNRVNDSLVVRAVLRAVRPGPDLLHAYQHAVKCDKRLKKRPA